MNIARRLTLLRLVPFLLWAWTAPTSAFTVNNRKDVGRPGVTRPTADGILTSTRQRPTQQQQQPPVSNIAPLTSPPSSSSALHALWSPKQTPPPESNNDVETTSWQINPVYLKAWLLLLVFAFGLAPGELGDNSLMEAVIADPVHPDINEAYYFFFNIFAPLPIILASLVVPQGQRNAFPPSGPFVFLSTFFGFFSLGAYLSVRPPPRTDIASVDDVSWVTRNVWENKLVAGSALAFLLYLPFLTGLLPDKAADPATWQGLWELLTTSRFASVSVVDLALLHLACVALIKDDYLLRSSGGTATDKKDCEATAKQIAAASLLLPFVGPALYVTLRPSLPVLQKEG